MACRGTRGASPSPFRAPNHPPLLRDRTEAQCCARQRIHRPLLRISVRPSPLLVFLVTLSHWDCFLFYFFFLWALTRIFDRTIVLYCTVRPPIGPSLSRSTSSLNGSPPRPGSVQGDVNSPRRSSSRMSDVGGSRPTSLQAPTVAPRQNRSAMLRVAKMANGA